MQSRSEESQTMDSPTVLINGKPHSLSAVPPYVSLLDWLRDEGLTGAKEGCAEGECGACSVLVASPGLSSATEWTAVNACLIPAWSMAHGEIITAEGLGDTADLHPVQREMALRGGSQCGYCTPGFVCSMAAEYYRPGREYAAEAPAAESAESAGGGCCSGDSACGSNGFDLHALSGNLCRCRSEEHTSELQSALSRPEA